MTRSLFYSLLIVLCLSTYVSCTENEHDILLGRINTIEVQDTIHKNETFQLATHFSGGTNGCATASHLEIVESESTLLVSAYYKLPRKESACLQVIPLHHLEIEYSFSSTGVKTIRDAEGNVTHEILVIE